MGFVHSLNILNINSGHIVPLSRQCCRENKQWTWKIITHVIYRETFEINCSLCSFGFNMCRMQETLWAPQIFFFHTDFYTHTHTHTFIMHHISSLCSVTAPVQSWRAHHHEVCVAACVSETACLSSVCTCVCVCVCVCVLDGMSHSVSVSAVASSNFFKGESNESIRLFWICGNETLVPTDSPDSCWGPQSLQLLSIRVGDKSRDLCKTEPKPLRCKHTKWTFSD